MKPFVYIMFSFMLITHSAYAQSVIDSYLAQGREKAKQRDYPQAIELFNKAIALLEKNSSHKRKLAMAYNEVAHSLLDSGYNRKGIEQYKKAIALIPTFSKAQSVGSERLYYNLANAYKKSGLYQDAIKTRHKYIDLLGSQGRQRQRKIARAYITLGSDYFYNDQYEKCIHYERIALRYARNYFPADHKNFAIIYHNISKSYRLLKQDKLARDYADAAIAIAYKFMKPTSKGLKRMLENYVALGGDKAKFVYLARNSGVSPAFSTTHRIDNFRLGHSVVVTHRFYAASKKSMEALVKRLMALQYAVNVMDKSLDRTARHYGVDATLTLRADAKLISQELERAKMLARIMPEVSYKSWSAGPTKTPMLNQIYAVSFYRTCRGGKSLKITPTVTGIPPRVPDHSYYLKQVVVKVTVDTGNGRVTAADFHEGDKRLFRLTRPYVKNIHYPNNSHACYLHKIKLYGAKDRDLDRRANIDW